MLPENWYVAGNFGQERLWSSFLVTRSDSESIFQQQFCKYHWYDGCYWIYFNSSTIVRLSGLLQKVSNDDTGSLVYYSAKTSRHRQNGLSYVLKKILTWMLREARGGLKATVGNRVKPDYRFIRIVFFVIFCFFQPDIPVFLCRRLCLKAYQHISDIVGLSQAEVWRTYLNLFNSHCYSFVETNLTIIKAYQNT